MSDDTQRSLIIGGIVGSLVANKSRSEISNAVRDYLMPTDESFWMWTPEYDAIKWSNGPTIAFRAELAGVLRRLAPRGLPPLGAVLLLISATRQSWNDEGSDTDLMPDLLTNGWRLFSRPSPEQRELLVETVVGLQAIGRLPDELKRSQVAREELADAVFEASTQRTSPDLATQIVAQLEAGLLDEWLLPARNPDRAVQAFANDLHVLRAGLSNITVERLRLRTQTGLDALPATAPVELPPCDQARALLTSLQDDVELSGLARVAQRLLAAVTLPRRISDAEDLPLGGVSDISNRGSLDRLLITELAHDDLTLAVRLSANEALYLRRESPPRTPSRTRALLIDCGLRTWGLPRVFGTSVALALIATADRHTGSQAWRVMGPAIEPTNLLTRDGLVAHLASLACHQHPGDALSAFCDATSGGGEFDRVLITTEDSLADVEFQRALAAAAPWPLQVASVTRDGRLRLQVLTARGSKLLKEATLDLSDLTRPGHVPPAAPLEVHPADLPAIMKITPFPLRLPYQSEWERLWPVGASRAIQVTHDRRLLRCEAPFGAIQHAERLPGNKLWWCDQDGGNCVVGHVKLARLTLLRLRPHAPEPDLIKKLIVQDDQVLGVTEHLGTLFVITQHSIEGFNLETGAGRGSLELPVSVKYHRERFFRSWKGEWFAACFNGTGVMLEKIAFPVDSPVFVFQSRSVEGPVGLEATGIMCVSGTQQRQALERREWFSNWPRAGNDINQVLVSKDGCRLLIPRQNDPYFVGVVLKPQHHDPNTLCDCRSIHPYQRHEFLEPALKSLSCHRTLRTQIAAIGCTADGHLALITRKGGTMWFSLDRGPDRIRLEVGKSAPLLERQTFEPCRAFGDRGYVLRIARWANGCWAILDSRGLLHLRHGDRKTAEVTVVLDDNNVSIWRADGKTAGDEFYLGGRPSLTPRMGVGLLEAFAKAIGPQGSPANDR